MIEFEMDARRLQRVLQSVSVIKDEVALVFSENGMSVVTMDGAQVILAHFGIRKSEFGTYDIGDGETSKVTFNIGWLENYLRGAEGPAMVMIKDQVEVMVPARYGFKSFNIPLLGIQEPARIPRGLEYDCRVKVDIASLQDVIRDARRIESELMRFEVSNNDLDVLLMGEKGTARTNIAFGRGVVNSEFHQDGKFVTTHEVLDDVLKVGSNFSDLVLLEFTTKLFPFRLTFQVPFDGVIVEYVAPIDTSAGGG